MRKKVLVLEDDTSARALLCAHVKNCGLEPIEARSIAEADSRMKEHGSNIVAILADGVVIDGKTVAFTKQLKVSGFSGPIIALSADADVREEQIADGRCTLACDKFDAGAIKRILLPLAPV